MVADRPYPVLTGYGERFPTTLSQDELWRGFFNEHFGGRRSAQMAFGAAGVIHRHAAINPLRENVATWSTGARMERYLVDALPLARGALQSAVTAARLDPSAIGLLVVASCTGYVTPGLDVQLARDLDLPPSTERLAVGHMGCHAAIPALGAARDFVVTHNRPAALVCVELSSLHLQPPTLDLEQVIVHSLFSDAAAALIVEPAGDAWPGGLQIIDHLTMTDVASIDFMTWKVTDLGFRMTLSRHVADIVASSVKPFVEELLERNGLSADEVHGWAVHPGGPKILEAVGDRLALCSDDLVDSYQTLQEHGNCSSPTILLVIAAVHRRLGPAPGQSIVALSFGPGMTLCAVLLRTT